MTNLDKDAKIIVDKPEEKKENNNILIELYIINYLLNIDNYNKYIEYINLEVIKEKYPEVYKLYLVLETRTTSLTLDEFELLFHSSYPALKPVEKEAYGNLFRQLRESEVRNEVLEELVQTLAQRANAAKLAALAWEYSEGKVGSEGLLEVLEAETVLLKSPTVKRQISFVTDDLDELEDATYNLPGLNWPLNCLRRSLGPLRRGNFGFLFARPERGKTTFLASVAPYMAVQAKELGLGPVIWINNEQPAKEVKIRLMMGYFGVTLAQLFSNKPFYMQRYIDEIAGHIKVINDDEETTKRNVEYIYESEKPSLVVIDQIDKIKGFKADRPDLVYGKIYMWARELSKTYCPTMGVCQASGEGEGVRWLTMDHVAEAKTAKQAEADWILGIGASSEETEQDVRFFNISKNKLLGNRETLPAERHGRYSVLIRPEIARYEEFADT